MDSRWSVIDYTSNSLPLPGLSPTNVVKGRTSTIRGVQVPRRQAHTEVERIVKNIGISRSSVTLEHVT